ncbi:ISCps4, transposase [Lentisphaera araneosa HTCC2155]|uniref:ISCps4, transposase n=1 Tax=Lentisphaera araneosa HTCC2155 TaxID=313628 RepID=A6DGM1_9BACT|nr:ISCps4, transposase [Lentisphaera araneosa HTCC2155]
MNEVIKAYEKKILKIYTEHEDYELFHSFPGAGPSIGPRLMAFFGDDRELFQSVEEVLKTSEVAPVTIQSGKMNIVRRRFLCDRFTQLSFVEFANNSVRSSIWAHEFYYHKKALNMPHFCILRALAYKWIRIMYRCWKTRTNYCEKTYLQVLDKRQPAWYQKVMT